ncbi:hypothetical protein ACFE04_020015 [Oxalis oulophora]
MKNGIESLWEETRELMSIQHLASPPPTPLHFYRDFISQNKPCIISNAISHWPALSLWAHPDYLSTALSSSAVSLHLTPNGNADSLVPNPSSSELCFASAAVSSLPFPQALSTVLRRRNGAGSVGYLQQQNDCFKSEYSAALGNDCDADIEWASEAFGSIPDAVNLWIGNHLSQTSFHKDHYENLYAVVSGKKHFTLLPPTDVHRLYVRKYPAAHYLYSEDSGEFTLEMDEPARNVPWCSVNPYPAPEDRESEMEKFPLYFNGPKPYEVTVNAGEILYLPSMWFHHVRQSPNESGYTIAINYWYDMQFDIKYAYFNFLQSIDYKSIHVNVNEDELNREADAQESPDTKDE